MKEVRIPDEVMAGLETCWAAPGQGSALRQALYRDPQEWVALVRQVLRLDIRNLHQRTGAPGQRKGTSSAQDHGRAAAGEAQSIKSESSVCKGTSGTSDDCVSSDSLTKINVKMRRQRDVAESKRINQTFDSVTGAYHVKLQGITVSYDILTDCTVIVRGAALC
jgi:hypothetical protein